MRFVDTKYLITKHVVNPEQLSVIICVDPNLWITGTGSIKAEIVRDFHAILPSVSLQKLSKCISVTQPVTLNIENVSPHGYKEDYTPRKTLKIEIGKNLFLAAQSALLSKPESVSLEQPRKCILVTQPVAARVENVSLYRFKEGYTPRKTLKIETGRNLFLAAQSALLSEPENDQDNSKSSKPNCR